MRSLILSLLIIATSATNAIAAPKETPQQCTARIQQKWSRINQASVKALGDRAQNKSAAAEYALRSSDRFMRQELTKCKTKK